MLVGPSPSGARVPVNVLRSALKKRACKSILFDANNKSHQEEKDAEFRERRRLNRSGLRQALRQRPNLLERQEKFAQQHSRRLAAQASVSPPPYTMTSDRSSYETQPCWKPKLLIAYEAEVSINLFLGVFILPCV